MFPPVFERCYADAGVTAVFGTTPCRIYPFGEAPQDTTTPYAVWEVTSGNPINCVSNVPDMDYFKVNIHVYADDGATVRSATQEIRDAIEPYAHVTGYSGEFRDEDTRLFRYVLMADWHTARA